MRDTIKLKGIGANMERMTQIQLFDLDKRDADEPINTFLYEVQKHLGAQIVSTSIGEGMVLVEYTIPAEHVKGVEESK